MSFDLHAHSVHSDGTTTPEQAAALAASAGLAGLALTDHDTTAGWPAAREACDRHGLVFVPGIELSTEHAGRSLHLLAYWVDPDDPGLTSECARLRAERSTRAEEIVRRLHALGVPVAMERVRAHAGGAPIGRPHIAAAMVEAGVVADVSGAFAGYLADDGPAYVPKYAVTPEAGVRLLVAAGGAPVLAHPGLSLRPDAAASELLGRLVDAGLVGVEAEHAAHNADMVTTWRRAAAANGLLVTGGSDFHGATKDVKIGARTTDAQVVGALQERASRPTVGRAPAGARGPRRGGPKPW